MPWIIDKLKPPHEPRDLPCPPCAQQEGGRFGSGRAGLGSVCERPSSDCSTSAAVFVVAMTGLQHEGSSGASPYCMGIAGRRPQEARSPALARGSLDCTAARTKRRRPPGGGGPARRRRNSARRGKQAGNKMLGPGATPTAKSPLRHDAEVGEPQTAKSSLRAEAEVWEPSRLPVPPSATRE